MGWDEAKIIFCNFVAVISRLMQLKEKGEKKKMRRKFLLSQELKESHQEVTNIPSKLLHFTTNTKDLVKSSRTDPKIAIRNPARRPIRKHKIQKLSKIPNHYRLLHAKRASPSNRDDSEDDY